MGEVTKLQPDRADYEQPGVDVQFITSIGNPNESPRQLTLKTTFFQGTDLATQKQVVRDMLSIADEVRAQYELDDLLGQLGVREKALKRAEEDVGRVSERHAKRREELRVEIDTMKAAAIQAAETHERQFRESGRRGAFKPSEPQQRELMGYGKDIDKLESELRRLADTEESERRDCLTALARGRQDLSVCREEIAKRRHILGLPKE